MFVSVVERRIDLSSDAPPHHPEEPNTGAWAALALRHGCKAYGTEFQPSALEGAGSPLQGRAVERLDESVIGPEHLRGDAPPGPPAFSERQDIPVARAGVEAVGEAGRLLHGEVAGRKGVRVAEAEQEVNVGRPGADALDGCHQAVRL